MTTIYCNPTNLAIKLFEGAPGDRYVLSCDTYYALDSYTQKIVGGTTWATRTRIEARVRKGVRDPVVFDANGADFALRLAHSINSNIEFVGITFANGANNTVKVTYASDTEIAHHVRFTDCEITGAYRSGLLATGTHHVEIVGGSSHHNGSTGNLDHGLYLASSNCLVSRHDSYANVASGICIYNGGGLIQRSRVEYCRSWANSQVGEYGAGILLASGDHIAYRNSVWGNGIGVQVYDDAVDTQVIDNVVGQQRHYKVYISPRSTRTIERGTQLP